MTDGQEEKSVTTFRVTATSWEHGYMLDIEGYGTVTQSLGRDDAEHMVRDWLELEGVPGAETGSILVTFGE